jgi:hypothetical protein
MTKIVAEAGLMGSLRRRYAPPRDVPAYPKTWNLKPET